MSIKRTPRAMLFRRYADKTISGRRRQLCLLNRGACCHDHGPHGLNPTSRHSCVPVSRVRGSPRIIVAHSSSGEPSGPVRYAVVGAGMAGIATAWHLLVSSKQPTSRVCPVRVILSILSNYPPFIAFIAPSIQMIHIFILGNHAISSLTLSAIARPNRPQGEPSRWLSMTR